MVVQIVTVRKELDVDKSVKSDTGIADGVKYIRSLDLFVEISYLNERSNLPCLST